MLVNKEVWKVSNKQEIYIYKVKDLWLREFLQIQWKYKDIKLKKYINHLLIKCMNKNNLNDLYHEFILLIFIF